MAKEDLQHRVRLLLQEALPMLCRSGLAQTSEFSVEALIGITLNKDDVFLVSIKETVKSDGSVLSKSANHESKANEPERNQRKKTPRKRKHSKSVKSSYSEESENASDLDTDHPDSAKRDRLDMSQDDESCPNPDYPSSETHRGDSENEDDSQEAVIVKEEPGVAFNTSGGGSTADQSFATNSFSRFGASSVHLQPPRVDATSPARLSQSLPLPGTSFSHSPNSQQAAALLETQAALAQGSMVSQPQLIGINSGRSSGQISRLMHRVCDNTWLCTLCNRPFNDRRNLHHHIKNVHFKERRHRCMFCKYRSYNKHSVRNHETHCKLRVPGSNPAPQGSVLEQAVASALLDKPRPSSGVSVDEGLPQQAGGYLASAMGGVVGRDESQITGGGDTLGKNFYRGWRGVGQTAERDLAQFRAVGGAFSQGRGVGNGMDLSDGRDSAASRVEVTALSQPGSGGGGVIDSTAVTTQDFIMDLLNVHSIMQQASLQTPLQYAPAPQLVHPPPPHRLPVPHSTVSQAAFFPGPPVDYSLYQQSLPPDQSKPTGAI